MIIGMDNFTLKKYAHIYVEEKAYSYEMTRKILSHFHDSEIIKIRHYKDIFSINNQDAMLEKKYPSLILAVNENQFLYEGSENCQSFGLDRYYYCLTAMNCPFDCEYCFLKGMYPSADLVIFVNIEDAFHEIEEKVKDEKALINLSYETDLAAIDAFTGMINMWRDFALRHENISFEVRTKAAINFALHNKAEEQGMNAEDKTAVEQSFIGKDNLVYAFTLSPDEIIKRFEHNTPVLSNRIDAVNAAISSGKIVRLCFDPMLHTNGYIEIYSEFFEKIIQEIDFHGIKDVSLGTFRIPAKYLKEMRKRYGDSSVVLYPYENNNGTLTYRKETEEELMIIAETSLLKVMPEDKIFIAKD